MNSWWAASTTKGSPVGSAGAGGAVRSELPRWTRGPGAD
jgi:hypothetical protein